MISKRALAIMLSATVTVSTVFGCIVQASAAKAEEPASSVSDSKTEDVISDSKYSRTSYLEYMESHSDAEKISDIVPVDAVKSLVSDKGCEAGTFYEREGVKINQEGSAGFKVKIDKAGLYKISLDYYPIKGKTIDIELAIKIDGKSPYTEASYLSFKRIWKDTTSDPEKDNLDNEITPDVEEVNRWISYTVHDNDSMTDADMMFYLDKGEHVISFDVKRESLVVSNIVLGGFNDLPSYSDVKSEYDAKGYKVVNAEPIVIDAEKAYEKSQQNIVMTADYSSASTTPANPSKIRLNTIGGESWNNPGQWISWEFTVPESGLYDISFKYRQDYIRGFKVYRTIYIDGEVPFKEFEAVSFAPNSDWENTTAGDSSGNPYYVYLEAGKTHTIKLNVTFEPVAEMLQILENRIALMNNLYLEIIAITGTSPDSNRDYYLEDDIPDMLDRFKSVRDDLYNIARELEEINGGVQGGLASFIDVVIKQLDDFQESPDKIPNGISSFKSNCASLSDMMLDMKEQSLLLDSIYIGSSNNLPSAKVNFFKSLVFNVRAFISSFSEEYNAVGDVYGSGSDFKCEPIEVWLSSARDQMNVLKSQIDDDFVPNTKIPVNLSLVSAGNTLTQAIIGGAGPDIALTVASSVPVTYSMRNALIPLDQFDDFDTVKSWFYDSAFISTEYEGHYYGLPETQSYSMLFIRDDIFEDLGLSVPNTWDELYDCVAKIQRKNMQIGIPPESQTIFATLLLQNGGSYYTSDKKKTMLDSQEAIDAFTTWTDFNKKYSLPLSYDALNRFRSGEIPILIDLYTFYNNLNVGAPEIKGLWSMYPIPGTVQEDGTINRTQVCDGNVCVMIRGAENPELCWEFMKWWVSADVQAEFGTKVESRLGVGGRYATANKEAFAMLPWSYSEQKQLTDAWEQVSDTPKIPGDYYVTRMISNTYRAIVYKGQNVREAILKYNKEINKEITRKRIEYGLEV